MENEAETQEQGSKSPELRRLEALQGKWKKIIEDRLPAYERYWCRADAVVERFEDIRETAGYKGGTPVKVRNRRKYNMLWANTETLQPVLFNKVPDPVVKRRWTDSGAVARAAAEMLERVAAMNAQREDVCFVDHTQAAVFNVLVPGTGVLWARYDSEMGVGTAADGTLVPQIGDQKVIADYVHWRDFMCSKANVWSQVKWIARIHWWSPREVERRFGEDARRMCEPTNKEGDRERDKSKECVCRIFEIWDKETREALFFNLDATRVLETREDPLKLSDFWPCPKPLFGVWSTADLIPIPYYCQYQDQANELDQVTTQIYTLLKACKVAGAYNEIMGANFQEMLNKGVDNVMVPVKDWASFASTGGMQGNVAMLDLTQVVQMLQTLFESRELIKKDLNEVTGIPDMFRGISSPLDAEGTNQLKVQWGASRVRDVQRDVQRMCKEWLAIAAEIQAEMFTVDNLVQMSGLDLPTNQEKAMIQNQLMAAQMQLPPGAPPPPIPDEVQDRLESPTVEEVVSLLRSEKLRGFSLDIESDSTIEGDDAKEREDRSQFVEVLTGMIERWAPIVAQAPEMLPMVKELVMFAIRPFRAGRGLEEEVERTFESLERSAREAANAPPQPDPMDKAIQAEMQQTMIKEQGDTQREQMQQQGETERKVMDIAAKQEDTRVKAIVDMAKEVVKSDEADLVQTTQNMG